MIERMNEYKRMESLWNLIRHLSRKITNHWFVYLVQSVLIRSQSVDLCISSSLSLTHSLDSSIYIFLPPFFIRCHLLDLYWAQENLCSNFIKFQCSMLNDLCLILFFPSLLLQCYGWCWCWFGCYFVWMNEWLYACV